MLAQKGFENEMSYKYNFCLVYHKGNHFLIIIVLINVREHLRGNQKWTKIRRLLCIHLNHRGVTGFQACPILKSALRCAWYNPCQYNTHSFIIVAADTAVMLGKTADQIKQMCRWNSNTFHKYIRLGFFKYQKHA